MRALHWVGSVTVYNRHSRGTLLVSMYQMDSFKKSNNLDECYLGRRPSNFLNETELNFTQLPKLYMTIASPPCRSVLMGCAALGVPLQLVQIDIMKGEHMQPDFLEKNPQHTIPLLEENDFYLWDSHAIMCYLATAYGRNDDLYPKDLRAKAIVDQRLYFDSSVLFSTLRSAIYPLMTGKQTHISEEAYKNLHNSVEFLEKFLDGKTWLAGERETIADICMVATLSSLHELMPITPEKYPNVDRWFTNCKQWPYYEENNEKGAKLFGDMIRGFIKE